MKYADELGNEMFQRTTRLEEYVLLLPEKYFPSKKNTKNQKKPIKLIETALGGLAAVVQME